MWQRFANRSKIAPRRSRTACRPALEGLEGRVVLSLAFDSVVGISCDTSGVLGRDNAVDSAGNLYVTGILYGPTDLDPLVDRPDGSDILTPRGSSDVYVAKYAPDNTMIWARRMGGDQLHVRNGDPYEGGKGIVVDGSGNVYVTGDLIGQGDFGSFSLTGAGGNDAFVMKINSSGTVLWATRWGGAGIDGGDAISVDTTGNVVSVGRTAKLYTDGSFTPNGFEIHKYSPTGAPVWTYRIDNPGGASSLATDNAGNIYVGGEYYGNTDFNADARKSNVVAGSATLGNGFVLKVTGAGAFGWVSTFVAKGTESTTRANISELAIDGAGSIVVSGTSRGPIDIDPSASVDRRLPIVTSTGDGFVVKLTSAGALTWATPIGAAFPADMALDAAGNVYLTGSFSGSLTPGFGLPVIPSHGADDAFVATLTSAGVVDWATAIGSTGTDTGNAIAVDSAGTVYLAGSYRNTVDFDPDASAIQEMTNTAFGDLFLLKLKKRS